MNRKEWSEWLNNPHFLIGGFSNEGRCSRDSPPGQGREASRTPLQTQGPPALPCCVPTRPAHLLSTWVEMLPSIPGADTLVRFLSHSRNPVTPQKVTVVKVHCSSDADAQNGPPTSEGKGLSKKQVLLSYLKIA